MTSTPPPPPPMQENQVPPTARMASAHQPYNGHVAESRYSLRSIVAQFIIILVISAVAAIVAYSLDSLAYARQESATCSCAKAGTAPTARTAAKKVAFKPANTFLRLR